MAYQKGQSGGGGYQKGGFRGQQGQQRRGWDGIHQQMFEALFNHPRMSQRVGAWLESLQANREPTNNAKCYLMTVYCEWFHRPNKEIVIKPWEDNGRFPQGQQQQAPQHHPQRDDRQVAKQESPQNEQPNDQPTLPVDDGSDGFSYADADPKPPWDE